MAHSDAETQPLPSVRAWSSSPQSMSRPCSAVFGRRLGAGVRDDKADTLHGSRLGVSVVEQSGNRDDGHG